MVIDIFQNSLIFHFFWELPWLLPQANQAFLGKQNGYVCIVIVYTSAKIQLFSIMPENSIGARSKICICTDI